MGSELLRKLVEKPDQFAGTAASYSFSMLGFLAAFLAIFVAVSHTTPFESYRRDGNLVVQLWLISLTMLVLVAAFVFSMVMLTSAVSATVASIVIYLIASSLLMILISLMPIVFILLQVANARAA